MLLVTGPPFDMAYDHELASLVEGYDGKKIVCGGTTIDILSRELNREVTDSLDFFDPELPPFSYMDGIDLVTEGILTLNKVNSIRDWLYIGKYAETTNISLLQANSIDAMLLLAQEINHPEIKTLYLPVDDGTELPFDVLQKGIKFALKQKQKGKKLLVACGAGISQSASFAVAIVKETENLSLEKALAEIAFHHPQSLPHPALWNSLCEYYDVEIPLREMFHILKNPDHYRN